MSESIHLIDPPPVPSSFSDPPMIVHLDACWGVGDEVVLCGDSMSIWQGDIAAIDTVVHLQLVAKAFL